MSKAVRMGPMNRNCFSKFIELANAIGWTVHVPNYEYIIKDNRFPRADFCAPNGLETCTEYFQLEKTNGSWQIQCVKPGSMLSVTEKMSTRVFLQSLDLCIAILKERNQRNV